MKMTPSQKTMTDGQINKAVENFRILLERHVSEFELKAVQSALGDKTFALEQFALFRRFVEMRSEMITRSVMVDITMTNQAALDATGRPQCVNPDIVAFAPRPSTGGLAKVMFFCPKLKEHAHPDFISNDELAVCFEHRRLNPADLLTLTAVNKADPSFADTYQNATIWKDGNGGWCSAAFNGQTDDRKIYVNRKEPPGLWYLPGRWFAGVRK